ncbi:unnamed protein product, partial [Ilex paraguariensis]
GHDDTLVLRQHSKATTSTSTVKVGTHPHHIGSGETALPESGDNLVETRLPYDRICILNLLEIVARLVQWTKREGSHLRTGQCDPS